MVWMFQTSLFISSKGVTPRDLTNVADMAFAAGQDYRSCRDSIYSLDGKQNTK